MALSCLRLRRFVTVSSSLLRHHLSPAVTSAKTHLLIPPPSTFNQPLLLRAESLLFFSSSSNRTPIGDDGKIGPDTILFEGCDYNHWLITMEFPKDPKPTPEEMVETYVQTLAKVVGSVEEAKKRMYACSTTTYNGFQAVMTEEMSEKFRGLPGVVFILPDSYIDPVNKEYGGDKYINGTIIPRPPPVQYGRSQGRYNDRNRNYDRPRYDRQREPMQHQGSTQFERRDPPPFDRQNTMQGGGQDYPPPPPPPPRNFPPGGDFRNAMQTGGHDYPPPPRNFAPSDAQQNTMQGGGQDYPQPPPPRKFGPTGERDMRGYGPPTGRDFAPPGNRGFAQEERRDYGQHAAMGYPQGERRDPMAVGERDYAPGSRDFQAERRDPLQSYNQGVQGNYVPPECRDFSQGERRDYSPSEHKEFGGMGQRDSSHSAEGDYGQGAGSGYGSSGYPRGGQSEYGHGQGWR